MTRGMPPQVSRCVQGKDKACGVRGIVGGGQRNLPENQESALPQGKRQEQRRTTEIGEGGMVGMRKSTFSNFTFSRFASLALPRPIARTAPAERSPAD